MAKPRARIAVIQFGLLLATAAVVARAAQLQLVQGAHWAEIAAAQRTARESLPAHRGTIYDRSGVPLAVTQEFYRVGIAPNEVTEPRELARLAAAHLGVSGSALRRGLRDGTKYLYYHGPFTATQVAPLRSIRGVHLEPEYLRFYPSRDLARPIVGRLRADGTRGASGLELALDSILRGVPGEAVVLKDNRGRRYDSPSRVVREPVPGHDVVLTLDAELQEIAEHSLEEAIARMDADGGDIVFLDPATGELLAVASRQHRGRHPDRARPSAFTDAYQPGSTAKLFTAAALLMHDKVDTSDAVSGEGGHWEMPITSDGDTWGIDDSHAETGMLTLAEAVQVSSNIAMAKFSQRLTSVEQYEMLRAFGFGSPSGVEFPSESNGHLARPHTWHPIMSRASIAMGYEFSVTPVQLAAAYAAIANNGVLLTPTLVREIRDSDGSVRYRHRPEPVRRVVTPAVAARLREFLREAASEEGTGGRAQLGHYSLLGKTGTAWLYRDGRYVPGAFTASFAALFPAEDPQLAIVVKIDNPRKGGYYAALTAAPMTRTMLQQALAADQVPLDRSRLATHRLSATVPAADTASVDSDNAQPVVTFVWPLPAADTSREPPRPVPAVKGASLRDAAQTLHAQGFRVRVRGAGAVVRTEPAAGTEAPVGTLVTIWTDE